MRFGTMRVLLTEAGSIPARQQRIEPTELNLYSTPGRSPSGLSGEEERTCENVKHFFATGIYYPFEMAARARASTGQMVSITHI